jgi:hypothetical protein
LVKYRWTQRCGAAALRHCGAAALRRCGAADTHPNASFAAATANGDGAITPTLTWAALTSSIRARLTIMVKGRWKKRRAGFAS